MSEPGAVRAAAPALTTPAKELLTMAAKPLPPVERLRQLLAYNPDTGALTWLPSDTMRAARNTRFAGRSALTGRHRQGYLQGRVDGVFVYAHRVAWAMHYGRWPEGQIDHANHDTSDNRISNLRLVDKSTNARNLPKLRSNTSGQTGVYWNCRSNKWSAMIRVNRKLLALGYFADKQDAVAARKAAEARYGFHSNHGINALQSA
jgi:hypothetical protein